MSSARPGPRRAAAGIALAAVGVIYSRLTGRRPGPAPSRGVGEPPAEHDDAPSQEVERARSELADELARRAAQPER